ncbi:tRNA pseudouridine(55) synthase TruB [Staphylococcus pseudintermedius]|nr:tRNA pseudouridine(55) synthase TruB [Staphylococcus pseudintermedius]MDF0089114.1 tRNA pseudouridine(55) synthase TruB [Staphylococcus pseudintermedius]MDF0093353.1 tRNA pseudouridine(55) synthase TruB [Staphylococcus pseudintermedius]MDF0098453.1 tRNA pseudouridine(55) synthase TruB [Staphylococcus pseudintermedius]
MYHGILPVYKERGLTSHDVVFKLRKILKTKKVGHTGTLDPEVDGVLPICIGQATKVSDYVMEMGKTYRAEVTLGFSTTTEDQTGDVLAREIVTVDQFDANQVDAVLHSFKGWTTQIPPMYSSVKVNGKKLYEYARNGETVERPKRQIHISHIARISDLIFENDIVRFSIEVTCGKGTYIRTLATDIGRALHVPAHMSLLTRTMSGGFSLDQALTLALIEQSHHDDTLQNQLLPLAYGLKGLPSFHVQNESDKMKIKNGQKFTKGYFNVPFEQQLVMVDSDNDDVLAIYEVHPSRQDEIKPKKVFN